MNPVATQQVALNNSLVALEMRHIKDAPIDDCSKCSLRKVHPKKERKYKKVASPLRKLSPILEEESAEKPKKAKKPAKKSTTMPTTCVVIRDTPNVLVSKKKAPSKGDKGKCDRFSSKLKVLNESQDKITGTVERTRTKPRVLDVPKYLSESENDSWGDRGDDDNDDDNNEVTKDDDNEDDVEIDANDDKEASDSEKTDSDEDENLNLNQNDNEKEEKEEVYVRTLDTLQFNDDDKEYDELYMDANVRSKVAEEEEKTEGSKQSSSISSVFASKFLNLDNVPPVIVEVDSIMNVKTPQEESSTQSGHKDKDKDKDEDPPARLDQGLKKRKTKKDTETSKGSKVKESKSGSSKGFMSQSKSSGKSA
nr:hypothetical protein [Tanacetum cinerariifolium]